jgi:hypothetical protein
MSFPTFPVTEKLFALKNTRTFLATDVLFALKNTQYLSANGNAIHFEKYIGLF